MKKLIILFVSLYNIGIAQSTLVTPKALVLPQYASETAAAVAIPTPTNGMTVYNSSLSKLMTYEPSTNAWHNIISAYHIDNRANPILRLRNNNTTTTSYGIWAETNSLSDGSAIYGQAIQTNPSGDSYGLFGENRSLNGYGYGVYGLHRSDGAGIFGESLGSGSGLRGLSSNGYGVSGTSLNNFGVIGVSITGAGGYFDGATGLITSNRGVVGLGTSAIINLNANERLDINGRTRIRHNVETAGIWFNNASNGLGSADGSFFGLQTATAGSEKVGILVGGQWNLTVDRAGNTCVRGLLQSNGTCTPSDFRYKKNIQPLNNSLQNILKLNGVSYEYRKDEFPDKQFSDKNQIGFIAQEIEKIYPEMVFTNENGYKSVDYARITPVLVEAIKEQQRKIDRLENIASKTENLEKEMQQIRSMLQAKEGNLSKN